MKFYNKSHSHLCGIDLHARCLYVCILDASEKPLVHKKIPASPDALMKTIAPFLDDIVIGVECMFSWYWLADFCEDNNISFILGHALYMRAIHGGKAKNDKIDSLKIALLMRSGMFPLAYVYPRALRGTRDLMRRRIHMMRKRAELLGHVHNTISQYNLPPLGKNLRYAFNRQGVAESFSDVSVQKSIAFDLALIDFYDQQLSKIEWHIKQRAVAFDQHAILLLRSVPGIGLILSLVILCEIHDIERFPRVQDFASYARLVKCKRESAGKTYGAGGGKIGNAYLKWAFSEAAVLFLRGNPEPRPGWRKRPSSTTRPRR